MLLTIKTDFSKSRFYNRNFRKICRTMTQVTHQSAKETHYDKDNNITRLTIDWLKTVGDTKARVIQHSTIDEEGILASHTINYQWKGSEKHKTRTGSQTLQIYTAGQLKEMLEQNGFQVLGQCALDGWEYLETESENIVMTARKV